MIQEAAVLRVRGLCIRTVRHRQRGDYALLYTSASGLRYLIDPNSKHTRVLEERDNEKVELVITADYKNLLELLAIIDQVDTVVNQTEMETHNA